ncbi:She9/Mdm33 family protein [Verticillium dahliae VdLs.17]|uniref:Sensitive to high expression protein 9, mitochondrial n=1 Tax=Verticillium dahliae (strain VdLs.17 / ATCC MYA-4575 / FGSC 10137) TaxID=498257 RepID=G2XIC8_VERDV|nr:She9/Mdm33 family protein [Verticillium dahliae VdLs.17]EGY19576.1 She9/Mdm33 family protein [Verticillium dahliae VdLs.17]
MYRGPQLPLTDPVGTRSVGVGACADAGSFQVCTKKASLPLARPASWRLMNQLARPSPTSLAARRHLQPASSLAWKLLRPSSPSPRLYSSSNSPPPPPPPSPPPKPSESESKPDSTQHSSEPLIESKPDPVTTNSSQPFLRDGSLPKSESTTSRSSSSPSSKDASSPPSSDAAPSSRTPSPFDQLSSRVQSSQLLTTTIPRLIDTLQVRLLTASQTLNDLTGYTSIERIKTQNEALETSLAAAHQRLRATRQSYKNATGDRAATQRETTTLLARKESWVPQDLERFTELYRRDHTLEHEVGRASEALAEAEAEEQRLSQALMAGMLRRYHEEQIWSDRIRRASTWGTWGLMGVNVLLFIVLQLFAEPWRRRRLVRAVVAEEKSVLESVRDELRCRSRASSPARSGSVTATPLWRRTRTPLVGVDVEPAAEGTLAAAETVGMAVPETAELPVAELEAEPEADMTPPQSTTWKAFLSEPALWRHRAKDLYSERRIDLRMRDASILVLQGAAAGAAVASSVVFVLLRRT